MIVQIYELLQSKGIDQGAIVISLAGHDRGRIYLAVRLELPYVWLCDGNLRPYSKLKKKRIRHVRQLGAIDSQAILADIEKLPEPGQRNAAVKKYIQRFIDENQLKEES